MAKEKRTKGQTTIYKITTLKTKARATGTLLKTKGKRRCSGQVPNAIVKPIVLL